MAKSTKAKSTKAKSTPKVEAEVEVKESPKTPKISEKKEITLQDVRDSAKILSDSIANLIQVKEKKESQLIDSGLQNSKLIDCC